jgi:hypothetical protein
MKGMFARKEKDVEDSSATITQNKYRGEDDTSAIYGHASLHWLGTYVPRQVIALA